MKEVDRRVSRKLDGDSYKNGWPGVNSEQRGAAGETGD